MPVSGPLSHLDLSVADPDRSIPFYAALLEGIGFVRFPSDEPGWTGEQPRRAAWFLRYRDGSFFGVDLRPAEETKRDRPYDRYAPGPHHVAFHAESREAVDRVHARVVACGGTVLDVIGQIGVEVVITVCQDVQPGGVLIADDRRDRIHVLLPKRGVGHGG